MFKSNKIIKLGLGLKEDLKNLIRSFNRKSCELRSYIDIAYVYENIKNGLSLSLKNIAKDLFGKEFSKFE